MKFLAIVTATILLFFGGINSYTQVDNNELSPKFKILFDGSRLSREQVKNFASEVYKDESQYLTESHIDQYVESLKSFQIVKLTNGIQPNITSFFSQIQMMDKYNQSLQRDTVIDPTNFNPLKYFFDFHSENQLYIKINMGELFFRIAPLK